MAHDWKNDPIKPGVKVKFRADGREVEGEVRMMSHDARSALVVYGAPPVERVVQREQMEVQPKD
jgi:hypothetical protein